MELVEWWDKKINICGYHLYDYLAAATQFQQNLQKHVNDWLVWFDLQQPN